MPIELFSLLQNAVERHIVEYGVTEFFVGRYGDFDRLAAKAVITAKKTHPEVKLTLLLPFHPYDCPLETPEGFDGTFYLPDMERIPKRYAIVRANQCMIRSCNYLIAFAKDHLGNSGNFVEYARKREKQGMIRVENLAEQIVETLGNAT